MKQAMKAVVSKIEEGDRQASTTIRNYLRVVVASCALVLTVSSSTVYVACLLLGSMQC